MPPSSHTNALTVLDEATWHARRDAHERRVRTWTDPYQERVARGEKHPVYDFLFAYYGFRPAWLRRWHPGPGFALAGESARTFLRWPGYHEVMVGEGRIPEVAVALDHGGLPASRREFVGWLRSLLTGMQERPPFFGCHGLHEWAMVYRQPADERRHHGWPLRFPSAQIAQIVEANPICCSHFDAFRFFTPAARPLNRLQPSRADSSQLEQRGCLHANMDLYKWAYKLAPFTPAELTADCFELARDIREVDMRASPYDLRALGFKPIPVETAAGRTEFEQHQRAFAGRAEPLRARLVQVCDRLLGGPPPKIRYPATKLPV